MWIHDRAFNRGVELGRYPLEALAHVTGSVDHPIRPPQPLPEAATPLAQVARRYAALFAGCSDQPPAARGDVTGDLSKRSREIKGAAYYLDADHAGICMPTERMWYQSLPHSHAIVVLVGYGRPVEPASLASGWLDGAQYDIARMRALEIAVSLMGHIRALGFNAATHCAGETALDLDAAAVLAGVAVPREDEDGIASPFLGDQFAIAAVTTDYALPCDTPLAPGARAHPLRYWFGINGATSGRELRRQRKRASHLSQYPMEQLRRVARPTTAIFDDEVPRVPKRAEFFQRARMGDLGAKAQQEVRRFAFKHPLTDGMMHPLRVMVPHQDGPVATPGSPALDDPEMNTRAIKSLSYHLGADLTGICEIPDYAWYSHGPDGSEIVPSHKYAVVMLIDQGYDTMEGASGDDWISGCQSMRGYIRGAEIAGVMAEFLRGQGLPARAHTNADSQVLHIPLVLLAGLGELSRIGELVLNPFVGPRFKSVVVTTDLPLIPDQPIDFGLQAFCQHCRKCARECPVNAIPFGDKVIFNGYEIWKPDVERCTRYRVTNPKGSACGRCMKTCPLNKVVTADGALLHRIGSWLGINTTRLKRLLIPVAVWLDDKLGYGRRNPGKRWWLDLEIVDGVARTPRGTNERDLDLGADVSGSRSPVGYYHASDMPPPNTLEPVLVDHKAAVARAEGVESAQQAAARRAAKKPAPARYIPTACIEQ